MQGAQEIRDAIQQVKQHLASTYKLQTVGVFGSVIRGEQRDGSDIDVLVDLDVKADLFDLTGIGQYPEEQLHTRVDPPGLVNGSESPPGTQSGLNDRKHLTSRRLFAL